MAPQHAPVVDPLVRDAAASEVAQKTYLRTLRSEVDQTNQSAVARRLGISPSAVSQRLATAARTAREIPEGFSAAGPFEIAQMYAAGKLDIDDLVDQLVRWDYVDGPESWDEVWDNQESLPAGTWQEVLDAFQAGYIDEELYGVLLRRVYP